jgi:hypothetical protein
MDAEIGKIMFEVYRELAFDRRYRAVYFTDLDEAQRDAAIEAACAGEHVFDGFIKAEDREAATRVLESFLARVNAGANASVEELAGLLAAFLCD